MQLESLDVRRDQRLLIRIEFTTRAEAIDEVLWAGSRESGTRLHDAHRRTRVRSLSV